ncbi:MAG: curved DNA-binding protein [Myxococcota bacterium]|jgi:curved DNA-binding protein
MRDLYSVLGVSRSADQDSIKKAYKKLARQYHPDLNKDPAAGDRFKEINAAYDVVGDEKKRKLYDDFGEASTKPGFNAEQARRYRSATGGFGGFGPGGVSPGRRRGRPGQGARVDFNDFGFNAGGDFNAGAGPDMDDLLNMFGGGRGRPRRGADVESTLEIDLREALEGKTAALQISSPTGGVDTIRVKVPAGIHDGGTIRLRGKGRPGPSGGTDGDLLLKISIRAHPHLQREGDDLTMEVPVTIHEALSGARIEVPTLDGAVRVKVPESLTSGTRLRLRGKGAPKRSGGRGDLFLVLRPAIPDLRDEAVLALAEQLEDAYSTGVRENLKL